jgi:hypothetical protein
VSALRAFHALPLNTMSAAGYGLQSKQNKRSKRSKRSKRRERKTGLKTRALNKET